MKHKAADLKPERGFTLIELMVVLLILSILMAVAIPNFLASRRTAEDSAAKQALMIAGKAAATFYASARPHRLPNAAELAGEEASLDYSDGNSAPSYDPDADGKADIAMGSDGKLRTTSESGTVWKIDASGGNLTAITSGN